MIAFLLIFAFSVARIGASECDSSPITLNSNHGICLILASYTSNWETETTPYTRYYFDIKVDQQMAVLQVNGAYAGSASPSDLITGTPAPTNLGYSVQLQTTSSLIRAYRDYTSSVWPSNTLIFNVQKGKITGVEWDLNCNTCSDTPKTCSKNTYNYFGSPAGYSSRNKSCYLPPSKCDKNNASCDINIFIAFSGTDKNGKVLNSAEARQSSFTRYDSSNLIPLPQK